MLHSGTFIQFMFLFARLLIQYGGILPLSVKRMLSERKQPKLLNRVENKAEVLRSLTSFES